MASSLTLSPGAERPVVIYDGECPFCLKQIDRVKRADRSGVFEYVPRQAEGLDERFPQLRRGDFNTGMRLVHTEGSVSVGADAVYEIHRRLPGYRLAAWLYRVPGLRQVFRGMYGWIAANRYRLSSKPECDSGVCEIPYAKRSR